MSDRDERQRPKGEGAPPGDFVSDDLRHETARFLAEVKRRIKNSTDGQREPKLGPPRRRSSR
jgi:hypothetical protein